jgi:hypothetical protein
LLRLGFTGQTSEHPAQSGLAFPSSIRAQPRSAPRLPRDFAPTSLLLKPNILRRKSEPSRMILAVWGPDASRLTLQMKKIRSAQSRRFRASAWISPSVPKCIPQGQRTRLVFAAQIKLGSRTNYHQLSEKSSRRSKEPKKSSECGTRSRRRARPRGKGGAAVTHDGDFPSQVSRSGLLRAAFAARA